MDYESKYKEALERAKYYYDRDNIQFLENIFPELADSEDEKTRKALISFLKSPFVNENIIDEKVAPWLAWLEKRGEPIDKGETSDGYHTFNELYYYRMLYNAAFFNLLPKEWVHKSKRHHDGEECFGGGWFIVMANLPTGQISNHYELKDWELFQIPEKEVADEWDGHTPQEAAERLHKYLLEKQGQGQVKESSILQHEGTHEGASCKENDNSLTREPMFKVGYWIIRSAEGFKHNTYLITEVKDYYVCEDLKGRRVTFTFNDVHKNFKLWDISDAKGGDVLASKDELSILIFRNLDTSTSFSSYYNIARKGELGWSNECFIPATKEQRDLLFAKMKEAGYEWNAEKKELKRIKQSPAWSEEDERFLNQVIGEVNYALNDKDLFYEGTSPIINWLKSLKQRLGGEK